ncbi:hypothetical protein, partial [Novacetimonas hansenii]|uniref:hypothetical protein n=1 Tax=Novacetimonas hansenii TaxID=436 RepID=UPI001C4CCF3A
LFPKSFRRRRLFRSKGGTQRLFLFFINALFSNTLVKILIKHSQVPDGRSFPPKPWPGRCRLVGGIDRAGCCDSRLASPLTMA